MAMIILMSKTHIPPDSLLRASRLVYVLKDYDVFQSSILLVFLFFFRVPFTNTSWFILTFVLVMLVT